MTASADRQHADPGRPAAPGHNAYRLFWVGHGVAHLGEWILIVALVALVYGRTGLISSVSLLLLARLLPRALLLSFADVAASWTPRRLPPLEWARAGLAVSLLWLAPSGPLWAVYAAVFACQAAATLSGELRDQLLPSTIARRELVDGNRRLTTTGQLAFVAGPTIGGLLAWWDARAALAVPGGLFLVAALLTGALVGRLPEGQRRAAVTTPSSVWSGLAAVRDSVPLRVAFAGCAASMGIVTSLLVSFPALFAERFGLSPALVGPALGLIALGALLAGVPIIRLVSRFPIAPLLVGMVIALACGKAAVLASGWLPLTVLVLPAIGGAALANELASAITVRRFAPAAHVDAVRRSLLWVATIAQIVGALGGGLAGHFLTRTGAPMFAAALDVAALALMMWLRRWPARQALSVGGISVSSGR